MTIVEAFVRRRAARAAGEFGQIPPWAADRVIDELQLPRGHGPMWDRVSDIAHGTGGPMIVHVSRGNEFLWVGNGEVVSIAVVTEFRLSSAMGDALVAEDVTRRATLYALVEVCRVANSRRVGGKIREEVDAISALFDAIKQWCASQIDGASLSRIADRERERLLQGPRGWRMADRLVEVCNWTTNFRSSSYDVSGWRAAIDRALSEADALSPGESTRRTFLDHMAETLAQASSVRR